MKYLSLLIHYWCARTFISILYFIQVSTLKASYCKVLLDDEEVVERLVDRLIVVVLDGPQVRFDQRQLLHLHKQSGRY